MGHCGERPEPDSWLSLRVRSLPDGEGESALWSGRLARAAWELTGPGRTYQFPRDGDGDVLYCTVEGVCWLRPDEVVVVSDRAKAGSQGRHCRAKDQSLHVFALPSASGDDRSGGPA
jgi:hypothetical protein